MKRLSNLYQQVCSIENLQQADKKARKGKLNQHGVKVHDKNRSENIQALHEVLVAKSYKTSAYTVFTIHDPKEREIFKLPYYPDRIMHHAIMNIMEPVFIATFTADTYSCIRGRGIHAAADNLRSALKDMSGTKYCLKLDIKKFYPSIDHAILKELLRRKIKDNNLLNLMDGIIDSADGLPIGNYLSQYFANFYLSYFDHWMKEQMAVKYYFRYADDLVILSGDKAYLHALLAEIRDYLLINLNLMVKSNYQVFPVAARSIDFLGYRFYHTHVLLRKRIKQNYAMMMARNRNVQSMASYNGWATHCNSKNLIKKLENERL